MYSVLCKDTAAWDQCVTKSDLRLRYNIFISRTTDAPYQNETVDDALHFLMTADNATTTTKDSRGQTVNTPTESFVGFSGTPVFAINDDPRDAAWTPHDWKVIGIQSMWIPFNEPKQYALRVVRIDAVIELIASFFPSVRELMKRSEDVKLILS